MSDQPESKVVDLMAALEKSVEEAKAARKRHTSHQRCLVHYEDEPCPPALRTSQVDCDRAC